MVAGYEVGTGPSCKNRYYSTGMSDFDLTLTIHFVLPSTDSVLC